MTRDTATTRTLGTLTIGLARRHRRRRQQAQGAEYDELLLLCTNAFEGVDSNDSWLIEPDLIVTSSVAARVCDNRVGIVMPPSSQVDCEAHECAN